MYLNRGKIGKKISLALLAMAIMAAAALAGCSASDHDNAAEDKAMSFEGAAPADMASGSSQKLMKGASSGESGGVKEESLQDSGGAPGSSGSAAGVAGITSQSAGIAQGKIIYTANLTMEVEELKAASSKLRDAIHLSGGYILEFQDTRYDGEVGATYQIKVPAEGFMSFIDAVSKIDHSHFGQSLSGSDVTEQYVDLESRLKARQLVEQRLAEMMEKAVKADELLQFSNQLGTVQEEIETIKGKIRYLDNNVAYSTVSLRMVQRDQSVASSASANEPGFGTKLTDTLKGSFEVVVEGVKLLIIMAAGALPVAAVLAVVLVPILMAVRRRRRVGAGGRKAAYGESIAPSAPSSAAAEAPDQPDKET
ncbi:DUF4349 domain-containing protein [Paenibacillus sp. PL2-23]|uniref:DUF4349 domain-containing protein n=1 Tax=Paenibacillus sp. PL2-23 TaxID=2100729 RepID=UPI0030F78157